MPASIRIIKIVKGAMGEEAYTVEFECEAEHAKDLLNELTASPYGRRLIELLNESKFLPDVSPKTIEELKVMAEAEEKEREEHEELLKERGRKNMMFKVLAKLRELHGDDFVKEFENALAGKKEEENATKKTESEAITTQDVTVTQVEDDREPE